MKDLTGQIKKSHNFAIDGGGQGTIYLGQLQRPNGNNEMVGSRFIVIIVYPVSHAWLFDIQVAIKVARVSKQNSGSPPPDKKVSLLKIAYNSRF
jgi:hypothetical protein